MARVAADAKVDIARSAVESAKLDGQATVRAALDAQKIVQFDVQLTTEREAQAKSEWQNAVRRLGVSVPLDEIVFIPSMPVRVEQVTGVVGGTASGPILSVTDNQLIIDSSLPLVSAPLVKPGMEVDIGPNLGVAGDASKTTWPSSPESFGADGQFQNIQGLSEKPLTEEMEWTVKSFNYKIAKDSCAKPRQPCPSKPTSTPSTGRSCASCKVTGA